MNPGARLEAIRRLTWLGAGLLLWGAAIFAKLISLQVVHHNDYLLRAQKQQEHSITLTAPRGTIFDRNGEALAMSEPVESVVDQSDAGAEPLGCRGRARVDFEHRRPVAL